MSLELTGVIVKRLKSITGESKNGTWQKIEFIIETTGKYNKTVAFSAWGDDVAEVNKLSKGDTITVSFEPQSREYNERWYTELRAWKIEVVQEKTAPPPPQIEQDENDLPF